MSILLEFRNSSHFLSMWIVWIWAEEISDEDDENGTLRFMRIHKH